MKTLIKLTTAVVFALSLTFSCSEAPKTDEHQHEGEEAHDHKIHDHTEMSDAVYYCPMECEGAKMYDKSGECPVCHMDLVEKK